ncbi:structural protein [Geobacillus phage vB_GthS_PK5.1]|nr:structural protein [Geobacillus phage vB_GthS_PK5.1]
MPRYPYRDLGTKLNRDFRNNLNANFDDIEADVRELYDGVDDLDTRIDNIVADAGNSNTEIVDARNDSVNNVTYPTLKDRLDDTSDKIGILNEFKAKKENVFEQTDYVEVLRRYANFNKMQIKKIDNNNSVEVSCLNDTRHITFAFLNLGFDDYITQSYVYTGGYTKALQAYVEKNYNDLTRTGTYVDATDTINGYTEQVGATWEVSVTVAKNGDSISLNTNANNRGGVWRVTLNNDPSTAIDVSTWSATTTKKKTELYSNLEKGTYVVRGEFIGEDPQNPPSISPARGWLNSTNYPVVTVDEIFADIFKDYTLNTPSNKDFAFYIKPLGGRQHEFVPYHGTPTAFKATDPVYKDGDKIIDVASMANGEYKSIDSFCLSQHIYGRHPESGSTNLIEVWTNQLITKEGMYKVDGKMKVLQPITINNSYVIMGVAKGDLFTLCVSSFGNSYPHSSEMYGQTTYLAEERDFAKSYCFLSSQQKNFAIAFRYNNIKETLRQFQSGKDTDPTRMAYLQHRDQHILKLYNRLWNTADLSPGYTLRFSGDYIYAVVENVYDLLS